MWNHNNHDARIFKVDETMKKKMSTYLNNGARLFHEIKEIHNLCLKEKIFRSFQFLTEETFCHLGIYEVIESK